MRLSKMAILVACAAMLSITPRAVHAIFGFGVHGGFDFTSIDEKQVSTQQFVDAAQDAGLTFPANAWTTVVFTREEVGSPLLLGGHAYIDALPFIDIEAQLDVALKKYRVMYSNALVSESGDVYFGRIGAYATVRRDILSLPMFGLYLGGGLGYHLVAPVAGPDAIVAAYGDREGAAADPTATEPDLESIVDREGTLGWHGVFGVRVKPPVVPIAIGIEGKYTATGQDDFEKPGNVFSMYAKLSFAI